MKELSTYHKYNRTKNGLISGIYGHQKENSKRRGHSAPTYTSKELKAWMNSSTEFHVIFDNWKRLDYQKDYMPSVDRIDDYIGYTLSNIQICTYRENIDKSYRDKVSGKNNKQSRAVAKYSKDGSYIDKFYSVIEAERKTGISNASIHQVCSSDYTRKSAGGFIWKFITQDKKVG